MPLQQAAVFGLVIALQHGQKHILVTLNGNVGDKAQSTLVNADQRQGVTGHLAADTQHGAIAPDDQAQVTFLADAAHVQRGVMGQTRVQSGFLVQNDLAALAGQKLGHIVQNQARAFQSPSLGAGVVFAKQRDVTESGSHRQITSLK